MQDKEVSRFLSRVLRHKPELIGIVLDEQGYTDIDTLIGNAYAFGKQFDHAQLLSVVANNNKQRFQLSDDGTQIRAVQGHSHPSVKRHYEPQTPPNVLYHGTAIKSLDGIKQHGLTAQSRHYVHLSADGDTAKKVGSRHGKAVVLTIDTAKMHADGHVFYRAENGVWLTKSVAVGYIEFNINTLCR
ncbi:MAG: RNA 2'-phosphotransferase [Moraxella sp.]|nr:RNA 2'-phosphotransferase [Moraxella sp.]